MILGQLNFHIQKKMKVDFSRMSFTILAMESFLLPCQDREVNSQSYSTAKHSLQPHPSRKQALLEEPRQPWSTSYNPAQLLRVASGPTQPGSLNSDPGKPWSPAYGTVKPLTPAYSLAWLLNIFYSLPAALSRQGAQTVTQPNQKHGLQLSLTKELRKQLCLTTEYSP